MSELPLGLRGTYREETVPDTLDLAERARLGVNHFTSIISESHDDEMYWRGDFGPGGEWPGFMHFLCPPLMSCQPKAMEALVMERLMSGSQQHLEREVRMVETMVSHLGEDDGIYWVPPTSGRKPWLGPEAMRPFANIHGQGRMMRVMLAWYQYTGDPAWQERIDRMVDGWDRHLVVHKDDHAYSPTHGWMPEEYFRSCYVKGRGWEDSAEPEGEKDGEEGSLFNHQGHNAGVLATWYLLTGNEQALRLSGRLVRFLAQPKFWADWQHGEYPWVEGAEHAHWQGHFHGHINTLRAILEYAIATNDAQLKAFVRDGYEWARQPLLARIGYVGPADGQGCGCARLIGLAVKLSDAGVGDYWEDVDQYIRNHGTEMQFTPEDLPYLRERCAKSPEPVDLPSVLSEALHRPIIGTGAGVVEASMGAFSLQPWLGPEYGPLIWALCCSTHGNMGLFYPWDRTLCCADGVVRIHLLLNRASPWMDVDSYLPYEGRVRLKNKSAREAFVRITLWVDRKSVRCSLGQQELPNAWFGNYLRFQYLKPNDELTIRFPMVERAEAWTLPDLSSSVEKPVHRVHTCRFKDNTVIEISPPLTPDSPFYHGRRHLARDEAPMKRVTRYVSPIVLRW